jgi:hypothetical protein
MMAICIYCGGVIGESCFDPQGHQERAFKNANMNETQSTIEKLRSIERGSVETLTRDECRILKTLDRSNQIRTKPNQRAALKDSPGVDAVELWDAWFEFQAVHEDDMQQMTCGVDWARGIDETVKPSRVDVCEACKGTGKNKQGLTCGPCNGIGRIL